MTEQLKPTVESFRSGINFLESKNIIYRYGLLPNSFDLQQWRIEMTRNGLKTAFSSTREQERSVKVEGSSGTNHQVIAYGWIDQNGSDSLELNKLFFDVLTYEDSVRPYSDFIWDLERTNNIDLYIPSVVVPSFLLGELPIKSVLETQLINEEDEYIFSIWKEYFSGHGIGMGNSVRKGYNSLLKQSILYAQGNA